ncbi:hypothetical protein [Amycolatopsis sp. NPDC004625]|uniref:hypothetical protein n=1 Tax=Amycolatopsis sp. NPDC004625 TaxID=3154670 RepID=UPI0033B9266D
MCRSGCGASCSANARLYETARKQQEWLKASAAIMRELLAARSGRPLELIAEHTLDLADADLVTVLRPDGERLRIEVAVGGGGGELVGKAVELAGTMAGQVFTGGEPLMASWTDRQSGRVPRHRCGPTSTRCSWSR